MAAAVSARRIEKPDSLSYQAATETRSPFCTVVSGASSNDEYVSPTIRDDAHSSVSTVKTPFSSAVSAAVWDAAVSSSTLVGRFERMLSSTMLPVRTGIWYALPVMSRSGHRNFSALAAPEDDG